MEKFEYWRALIFELILKQGNSSTKPRMCVYVYSIVSGLSIHISLLLFIFVMINRWDLKHYPISGPSYTLDTACSSSVFAIEHAYRAMRNGLCDSAIVGGSNLCLHPYLSLSFFRLGALSRQGMCRAFDRDGKHLSSIRCDMYILIIMNMV